MLHPSPFAIPCRRKLLAVLVSSLLGAGRLGAQELPVPCGAGACGAAGPSAWVTSGAARAAVSGSRFEITQETPNATFNWRSFNIGSGGVVEFKQPDVDSVALNRVYGAAHEPSRILGALRANGQVYLLNQNGVLFGDGARVDVGGLLVSSLDLTPAAVANGLTNPATTGQPALTPFRDASGQPLQGGDIEVAGGAVIEADAGGRVLMLAPNVTNSGAIATPEGQTLLAAGSVVYLAAPPDDANLRGLLVEVGVGGGAVTNEVGGRVIAERGNVTLAGLAVNQRGRISASTSVRVGGSIRLLARDGATVSGSSGLGGSGGALTLGEGSVTEVTLVDDLAETTVDVNVQPSSRIVLEGRTIDVLADSLVSAAAGSVTATAQTSWGSRPNSTGVPDGVQSQPDTSRIYVADGATIDVAGATISLPMERNVVAAELRGSQVADSPAQREGALRSQRIFVDIRASGTRPDGSEWQGTPLADVRGDIALVPRSVRERSLAGGTVNLVTQGDLVLARNATLDVSGGAIDYRSGYINTSSVLDVDGRVHDIATADPDRTYVGFIDGTAVEHRRWGVTETFTGLLGGPGRFEEGYQEGKDAGTVRLIAPRAVADGAIVAATRVGRHQRNPASGLASGRLYRAVTERPLGGRLLLGNEGGIDLVLEGLTFAERTLLDELRGASGQPFDPLVDRLPVAQSTFVLRPSLFGGGITRLEADVNERIELSAATTIDLAPGAAFDLATNGSAELAGRFRSAVGEFAAAAAQTLSIAGTATIDVAGQWVNDDWRLGARAGTEPRFIDGGNVSLAGAELAIDPNAAVNASGGAARSVSGAIQGGHGGEIELSAEVFAPRPGVAAAELTGRLESYSLSDGGTLRVRAGSVCISAAPCSDEGASLLLTPDVFARGGFGRYVVTASFEGVPPESTVGDLRIAAGTVLAPVQQNYVLSRSPGLVVTGTPLAEFAEVTQLPPELRSPVDVTLRHAATTGPVNAQPYTNATLPLAGALIVERGAAIEAGVQANVTLESNTRIVIDGSVRAPGGTIAATLTPSLSASEFLPAQAVVLGESGVFDVRGVPLVRTDAANLRSGQVLQGGAVRVRADRGAVVLRPGSVIDVSGATGTLDVRATTATGSDAPVFEAREVASAGGAVEIAAAEGVFLGGSLRAASGNPATVAGGSIEIALDPSRRNDSGPTSYSPPGDRDIRVVAGDAPLVVGSDIPAPLWGTAYLPVGVLNGSGADALRLRAANTRSTIGGTPDFLTGRGAITFVDDASLAMRSRIELDAATLRSTGGAAHVSARVVSLGNQSTVDQATNDEPTAGSGTLGVSARLLELVGRVTTSGFAALGLSSDGELRLRGIAAPGESAPTGALRTTGSVELRAQQIVPTTLSDFTIAATGANLSPGSIVTVGRPGSAGPVLSAGGRVRLEADEIVHAGVVRAPLGSIELAARGALTVENGSVLSTSTDGATIPFGVTQGGFDWAYELPNGRTLVYGPQALPVPAQRVLLDGASIDFRSGAAIDLRGGGELQAYEFVPGVTGTRDVLSPLVRPEQFALLPAAALEFAPYDAAESALFRPEIGRTLTIPVGFAGLAAGTYALLPARYALLPGALLVTRDPRYLDIVPGETFATLDGGIVGAGREGDGTLFASDSRLRGYVVHPGSRARVEARYDLTTMTGFFGRDEESLGALRLARDAGSLTLLPRLALTLGGSLLAAPATGGRGAALEVAADELRLARTRDTKGSTDVVVAADELSSLGAASVVLGARTTVEKGRTTLQVASRTVDVDEDVRFSAPEIVLAARERVEIGSRAVLSSQSAPRTNLADLLVDGDNAVVRVAGGSAAALERTGTAMGAAEIVLAADAELASPGSLLLDAAGEITLDGRLATAGGALWLGARTVALGNAPSDRSGLVLDDAQLAALDVSDLVLRTPAMVDVFGDATVSAGNVRVDAAGIRATSEAQRVELRATRDLELAGSAALPQMSAALESAALRLSSGGSIRLGAGAFALDAFEASALDAGTEIFASDDGRLASSGDLMLTAARLAGEDGAGYSLVAGRALEVAAPSATTGGVLPVGFGVRLDLEGETVTHRGRIEAPSGVVRLAARSGDVLLTDGALVDVAGRTAEFGGLSVAAPGGVVELRSDAGSIVVGNAASIDVSAAAGGDAPGGLLELMAPSGGIDVSSARLRGLSSAGGGAELVADAAALGDLTALSTAVGAGGFFAAQSYRQRAGSLALRGGAEIAAERIALTADQGAIRIDGTLAARAARGGRVTLAARDDVVLEGTIDAGATAGTSDAGRVDMASRTGLVRTGAGASIDVGAADPTAAGGTVNVRLTRDALGTVLSGGASNPLRGAVRGHDELNVLGYQAYQSSGSIDFEHVDVGSSSWFADAAAFAGDELSLLGALGLATDARARVLPEVEVRATGNLTLAADWDLTAWRFGVNGDRPGVLTLAAGGDLTMGASLSDGFDLFDPFSFLTATGDSWSYRLVAGADFLGADPLAVRTTAGTTGTFTIAAGVPGTVFDYPTPIAVRTGTGSIDVAAARDVRLGNQASVLYTGGVDGLQGIPLSNDGGLEGRPYPTRGGDVSIRAGGNLVGATSNQLVTDWLWRTGSVGLAGLRPAPTGWTVNQGRFQQNVAALAGGDVTLRARGDIVDFSASIPSIGRQDGGETLAQSRVAVTGGGNLDVRSGGSIVGGSYFVGRGSAVLRAGDSIGRVAGAAGTDSARVGPILALQDANVRVLARRDIGIEAVVNPTLLPQGTSQGASSSTVSYFSTYGATSGVDLLSAGGDVHLFNNSDSRLNTRFGSMNVGSSAFVFGLYPPRLTAVALGGNLTVHNDAIMYPAEAGDLRLLAGGDVNLDNGTRAAQIVLADTDPAFLPTAARPTTPGFAATLFAVTPAGGFNAGFLAPTTTHLATDAPAIVAARTGDVRSANAGSTLFSAKPISVYAGRDIRDLDLVAQNLDATSLTTLRAGRDIAFTTGRAPDGRVLTSDNQIRVLGPGRAQLSAGRDVDLQTSLGISTLGNTLNPALAERGADISVLAGVSPAALDYAVFIDTYLDDGTDYDARLIEYVRSFGADVASKDDALRLFAELEADRQRPLIESVFLAELRAGGRAAAQPGAQNGDFTRAFAALEALFPGSNPNVDAGETNPYAGDVRLFFSRIYTLDGGDISLLAPGGEINVGLATPPTAFGITKAASELGVVAQSTGSVSAVAFADFQVNESRVFAADGGDILVWATRGDIDAGRGAKTAISAPPPRVSIDAQTGLLRVEFPPALAGSGIQTLATTEGREPGNVDLFAPRGVVNAGDAGIVAGNLTIAATAVLGADNISVSGVSVGVPVDTGGFAAALTGVSAVASSASNAAEDTVTASRADQETATPLADQALGFLDVFITGFGDPDAEGDDEPCDPEVEDCQ